MPTAGYSGTPLAKKLGIKENTVLCVLRGPSNYDQLVAPLPPGVKRAAAVSDKVSVIHVFSHTRKELAQSLERLRTQVRPDAAVWVSWPKKSSKVPTDITDNTIREVALPLGFVDIKVCAVDDIWSGLKLVIRKELR